MKTFTLLLISLNIISIFNPMQAQDQKDQKVQLVLDTKSQLGEGAIWHPGQQKLYWIDIIGQKLHAHDPASDDLESWDMPDPIGTVVPAENGKFLVALKSGIHWFDPETEELKLFAHPEKGGDRFRYNDGKCDPAGRFWVGSMGPKKQASLYCIFPDGSAKKVLEGISTSNGICWSEKKAEMYYIDTPTRIIQVFDYDKETGKISNGDTAVVINPELGAPDGMCIDAEGHLWVGIWGGHAVACFDPESGKHIRSIPVPAKNVTSCWFGGPGLEVLYITTARVGTDEEILEKYPHAGGLFRVKPGAKGSGTFFFKTNNE